MVDYIDRFSYVELSINHWDEAYLVMVDDFSDVFLDLVCQYFMRYFYISVHEGDWCVILFLSNVFVWFGCQGNYNFVKGVWQCPFRFYCVEQFEEYWY